MTSRTVTAFGWVPEFAQGLVRDLRVRWALEEAGFKYRQRLIGAQEQMSPAYRAQQPFGQVPVYQEDELVLFESGAIVWHIARQSDALLPADDAARARVRSWLFAALDSVEPQLGAVVQIDLFEGDEPWAGQRRAAAAEVAGGRLTDLAAWLDGRDYLTEGRFTAADLMMTTVLRMARHTDLVTRLPVLANYLGRCEARPAFRRALADHMAPFATGQVARGG